jgi:hypothetical protein
MNDEGLGMTDELKPGDKVKFTAAAFEHFKANLPKTTTGVFVRRHRSSPSILVRRDGLKTAYYYHVKLWEKAP